MRALAALLLLCAASPALAEGDDGAVRAVEVYASVGSGASVSVRGRVLTRSGERGGDGLVRNANRLLGSEGAESAVVTVRLAAAEARVLTDADGAFEATFAFSAPLATGAHEVTATSEGVVGRGAAFVAGPDDLLVVSDFDDTVAVTNVTEKRGLVKAALFQSEATQPAVEGMAALYGCLREKAGGRAVFVYLSGSPVQYQSRVEAFLKKNGFPPGALYLRRLADAAGGPERFKLPRLKWLFAAVPAQRAVLFGDSGERDPEIYAALAKAEPRASAVFIREVAEAPERVRPEGQVWFRAPSAALEDALARGLVSKECAEKVRAAK